MGLKEMALFVKKLFNIWQKDQFTSVEKAKEKPFKKIKFIKKSSDNSGKKQCFECHDFGHIATDCIKRKPNEIGFW